MAVTLIAVTVFCLPVSKGQADDQADALFTREVLPVLARHCQECHGDEEPEAGLRLTSRGSVLHGSASSHVVVPGQPAASLITRLVAADGKPHMPPDGQLSEQEIAVLSRWIQKLTEADLPARDAAAGKTDHWAFQPMSAPPLPDVKQVDWVTNTIDRFVLARLEAAGLSPAPPADKATLARRAYFNLTGLPPSPEDVQAFTTDTSPDAYERLLDRLLASPAYGERWARHWLDLARYADSGGFHDDLDRPHAWRYRDYVIGSFNQDKPYAQFVQEQIAGDELAPEDLQALAATGFCRNGPSNDNNMGPDKEKYRLDQLDEVISTTSTVFMGLTLGCARCHDHKYDPIPQTDYYRLLAIFNNLSNRDVPLDAAGKLLPKGEKTAAAVMAVADFSPQPRPTYLLYRGDVANRGPEVQPGVPEALKAWDVAFAPQPDAPSTQRRLQFARWLVRSDHPLTWRVIVNRVWQHHFGRGLVGTPSNFGLGGDAPTHPELLDWLALDFIAQGGHFKALHKQIMMSSTYRQQSRVLPDAHTADVDPDNRLLWRMNPRRLEAEAVRDSVLAVSGTLNLAAGGPGIKPRIPPELLVASQRNKWPVVQREGPEHWRRSVYVYIKRQLPLPFLELLDAPNSAQSCARRDESTVPTQALVLMNDQFTQDQAGYFAERVVREAGSALRDQAERALWLAFSREPSSGRVNEAMEFLSHRHAEYEGQGKKREQAQHLALADLCHVLLNCNEFVYID